MDVSREIRLDDFLIAGTDDDVANMYRQLPERARDLQFGLLEDEVIDYGGLDHVVAMGSNVNVIVLDTETTGLNPSSCSLLEIAAIRMCGGETVGEFHTFVDPGYAIPEEITELTGITQADVTGAPSPCEAVAALAEFAGGRNLVAHNAGFDRDFVMRQVPFRVRGSIRSPSRKSCCRDSSRIALSTSPPRLDCTHHHIARWTTPSASAPCGASCSQASRQ